nr:leukocyte tyrosine kinase receptor [Parasteatoda tepidariorum]
MLYYSVDVSTEEPLIKVVSPVFEPNTLPTCAIQFALHMYQMDPASFKMVIKTNSTTWESASFKGNSAHKWENVSQPIGRLTQPFRVVLEILNPDPVIPSHVAIDNIRPFDCYDKRSVSTDCGPRQFQCYDLICIDASQVCDTVSDCIDGEDEDQGCDKIPKSGYCTFENDMCGWTTTYTENSEWIRRKGESPSDRTGPSFDHTFQNSTGTYLVSKFPAGKTEFGAQTTLQSPWFSPPPYYHRNVHSQFYNSCQVRFFFHKFGNNIGQLRVFAEEAYPSKTATRSTEILRSYGNKGNLWKKANVFLPNISNEFQLQFVASRGIGNGDIAIDDITLSPECFGIGVPENESIVPSTTMESSTKEAFYVRKYMLNTCGAQGRLGPNETLCLNAYHRSTTKVTVMSETTLDGIQKWIVPESGIYTLFVRGAGGGQGIANSGKSLGASLRAGFDWEKGDLIYFLVGQKGIDACGNVRGGCDTRLMRRSISKLRDMNNKRREGGGGGGGGATYIFKIDDMTNQRIPLAIAAGGGGLSSKLPMDDNTANISPHGLMPNSSILPINGYTGSGAGGGGGWDDNTGHPTSGESLREGGRGGMVCMVASAWGTDGGFGGGGGGCTSGGGGGGHRGGDAAEIESPYYNGQGGTSYIMPNAIRTLVEPGSNSGDGSVVIVPAQACPGCQYLCVFLDVENMSYYCICPAHLTISIDGVSCNGPNGMSVSPKMLVGIILGVVIFLSVLIIGIFFATTKYRKMQRSRDVSNQPLNSPDEQLNRLRNIGGMVSENNPNYEFGGNTFTEQDLKKVPRENLNLFNALGNGAFGEVYQGTLRNPVDNIEMPVAVKTLPELSSNQSVFDFLMEALIMSKFSHPNIVSFIGVCFDKMPRYIVLELLPGGDLKSFLRECRPRPNKQSTLTISDLLKMALDVATGCQYLEENHFIHRDIAARNCLLTTKDANRVVKIADFGMARDIYRADYYRKGGKAVLPVKWMPPEAFLDGVFTSKTDVWSFGVLLWEVISLGYMPYPGRGNQEVMQLVTSGGRLEPPTNCPAPIYHIMMQCWHPHPDQRPNFSTIIERLGYCLQDPDVINAVLPIFKRAPSMERDTTVMRPVEDGNDSCLHVQAPRPDPGLLLSPGSEDYLIPTPRSSYSLNTEGMSSPSRTSADQLLELEQRGQTPSSPRPAVWETNFMTPETPTEPKWMSPTEDQNDLGVSHSPMRRQGGYSQENQVNIAPNEDRKGDRVDANRKYQPNGSISGSGSHKPSVRTESIRSIDDLPLAPSIGENVNKMKANTKQKSNLSLDPSELVRQMAGESNSRTSGRYLGNMADQVCVDVNCNTGSNSSLSRTGLANQNRVSGPFDGFSGVNPVA